MELNKVNKDQLVADPYIGTETFSFPSLGEIVKSLFDHSGLLANKGDKHGISEQTKKKIQIQLRRLAKEESELENNLQDLLKQYSELLQLVNNSKKFSDAFMNSVIDILVQYKDLIRGDGTFLNKPETIKFVLVTKLIDRLVLSYQKNSLAFNISSLGLTTPKIKGWWLPVINEEEIEWPISRVFKWIYGDVGINQTRFHFPNHNGKNSEENDARLNQNLENASRWFHGKTLPTWFALSNNLQQSRYALNEATNLKYQRSISDKKFDSYKIVLFIARLSTSIFKMVEVTYGRDFLLELINQLRRQDRRLGKEHGYLLEDMNKLLVKENDANNRDKICYDLVIAFWEGRSERLIKGANNREVARLLANSKVNSWSRDDYISLISYLGGSYHAATLITVTKYTSKLIIPQKFAELLFKGFDLKKKSTSKLKELDEYQKVVQYNGFYGQLQWLCNWVLGVYYYRQKEYEIALPYYQRAFETAKYSAGQNQYLLINQYIEVCAKNNKWVEFKKGIAWANYIGIEVRWYRGFDESNEPLKITYQMMKIANYPIL